MPLQEIGRLKNSSYLLAIVQMVGQLNRQCRGDIPLKVLGNRKVIVNSIFQLGLCDR
jgi:hypothetical protein